AAASPPGNRAPFPTRAGARAARRSAGTRLGVAVAARPSERGALRSERPARGCAAARDRGCGARLSRDLDPGRAARRVLRRARSGRRERRRAARRDAAPARPRIHPMRAWFRASALAAILIGGEARAQEFAVPGARAVGGPGALLDRGLPDDQASGAIAAL